MLLFISMNNAGTDTYLLSTGEPVTALSSHPSPLEEYLAAFEDREQPFFQYYFFDGKAVKSRALTRGEFWDLAGAGAAYLHEQGVAKGDRILHCFSHNSFHDAVFRLAAVLVGCVPVTVNWQVDDNKRVVNKAEITGARFLIFDEEFASRIEAIKSASSFRAALEAKKIETYRNAPAPTFPSLGYEDERMVIFTSGTTGEPKGVSLPYRCYLANRLTFERYLDITEAAGLDILLVNPLHHSNSSAFLDWSMRRRGTRVHIVQRYSTLYWKIVADVARHRRDLLIAPMVARHFDFLNELSARGELPVAEEALKEALGKTDIMIGSAPVGPTTVQRAIKFSNHLPIVRFGATETCLQVMATPRTLSQDGLMQAFQAGWSHSYHGESIAGYYIGREHFPVTRIRAVRSIDPEDKSYMLPCEIGEPGYLVTQGANIMSHYIGDSAATKSVFHKGWYTGLRDIVFTLKNEEDGELDYYWVTRDSALLIRGGANYAYDQVAAELSRVLAEDFQMKPEQFKLAVVGLRVESEHEDSCCVTIELSEEAAGKQSQLEADFKNRAREIVPKGFRPDYVRLARIPTNFKGLVLIPELRAEFAQSLKAQGLKVHT